MLMIFIFIYKYVNIIYTIFKVFIYYYLASQRQDIIKRNVSQSNVATEWPQASNGQCLTDVEYACISLENVKYPGSPCEFGPAPESP